MKLGGYFIKTLSIFIETLSSINLMLYIFSLALGVYLFNNIPEAIDYSTELFTPFIIFFMVPFQLPFSFKINDIFFLTILIYILCFTATYFMGGVFHKQYRYLSSNQSKIFPSNWLTTMPYIAGSLLFIIIILQRLQESQGVPTGSISFQNSFEALFNLSYSPIIEEIGFRITPLGMLIGLIALKNLKRINILKIFYFILSFFHPEYVKRKLGLLTITEQGLPYGLTIYEWILVILSSIVFGLAHFLFGGGWDIGKISSASIAGLVLALVFLWRGAPACILLHWFFNYYGYVYQVGAEYSVFHIAALIPFIDLLIIFSGVIGLFLFGMSLSNVIIKIFKR